MTQPDSSAKFASKYELWRSWCSLNKAEPNSIERQLVLLLRNDLEFRVIEKARILGNVTLGNPVLRNCLSISYATTQMAGVRRLIDKGNDVVSLARLSRDIRDNKEIFTRRNYVCHGGLEYTVRPTSAEGSTDQFGCVLPDSAMELWIKNFARHQRFDLISGKKVQSLNPEDQIDIRLLDEVDRLLKDSVIMRLCQ